MNGWIRKIIFFILYVYHLKWSLWNDLILLVSLLLLLLLNCFSHVRLCADPIDDSPPGSSVHGIFPGKSTGVGCHFLLRMYSAYKLNKQGDNIQPWRTPFPIWNESIVPCPVLTVASWPAYRFLRRQVRWSVISISWRISAVCCDPHSQRLWHTQ